MLFNSSPRGLACIFCYIHLDIGILAIFQWENLSISQLDDKFALWQCPGQRTNLDPFYCMSRTEDEPWPFLLHVPGRGRTLTLSTACPGQRTNLDPFYCMSRAEDEPWPFLLHVPGRGRTLTLSTACPGQRTNLDPFYCMHHCNSIVDPNLLTTRKKVVLW